MSKQEPIYEIDGAKIYEEDLKGTNLDVHVLRDLESTNVFDCMEPEEILTEIRNGRYYESWTKCLQDGIYLDREAFYDEGSEDSSTLYLSSHSGYWLFDAPNYPKRAVQILRKPDILTGTLSNACLPLVDDEEIVGALCFTEENVQLIEYLLHADLNILKWLNCKIRGSYFVPSKYEPKTIEAMYTLDPLSGKLIATLDPPFYANWEVNIESLKEQIKQWKKN